MAGKKSPKSINLNLRATPELLSRIDQCRADLLRSQGSIPTRSEFVRLAVEAYVVSLEKERR